jgi:hypothetical protein
MSVQIPFITPWHIHTPTVHRFLGDQRWVDAFFDTGNIRLAAFQAFRTHPDEVRKDDGEGLFFSRHETDGSNNPAIFVSTSVNGDVGRSSYVLCASLRHDLGKSGKSFFTINDTTSFAYQISRQLPGFVRGWEGFCMYGRERIARSEISAASAASMLEGIQAGQPPRLPPIDLTVMFAKPIQYAEELEHRMVFEVDHAVTDAAFVNAPLARQFCRRP